MAEKGKPMDPDATFGEFVSALSELEHDHNDVDARTRAVEHLRALANWLETGGFPPQQRS